MVDVDQISIDDVTQEFFNELKNSFSNKDNDPHWNYEKLKSFVSDRNNLFLLGWHNGKMAGYVYGFYMNRPDDKKKFLVYLVSTSKKFQRKGVATAILKTLFEIIKKDNADSVWIPTDNDNIAAINLYKKFGGKMTSSDVSFVYEFKK